MSRNVVFTDHHLYFVTKKLHKLVEINIAAIIEKIKEGESNQVDHEEGKFLGVSVADFLVEKDGTVWLLNEDTSVEKLGSDLSNIIVTRI